MLNPCTQPPGAALEEDQMMAQISVKLACFGVLVALALPGVAQAQATRTWISGVGDDVNPCSRTAPCKTFAGAISKTVAGGEIDVMDPGGFGAVTITKSITLRSVGAEGGVLVANTNGIIINAGANDRVVIEGLTLEGLGLAGFTSPNGINVLQAGNVLITRTSIHAFTNGVHVGGSTASRVTLSNVQLVDNTVGVLVDNSAGLGKAKVFDSLLTANATAGFQINGAGNDVLLANNKVIGSVKAVDLISGGTAHSYGDNVLTSGDVPTPAAKN